MDQSTLPSISKTPGTHLRIANLNAWIGHLVRGLFEAVSIEPPGNAERRKAAIVAHVKALDPDVVTLQECLPLPGIVRDLAEALDYDVLWRVCNGGMRVGSLGLPRGMGRGEGVAILARKSLGMKKLSIKRLSGHGLVTNWCSFQLGLIRFGLAGLVHVLGRPVIVCSTHIRYSFPDRDAFFEGWAHLRQRGVVNKPNPPKWLLRSTRTNRALRDLEIRRLGKWLTDLSNKYAAPVVMGTDFNLNPDAPQLRDFLEQWGYTNVVADRVPDLLTWDPAGNANVAMGTTLTWPDGSPKDHIMQLMAYLDSVPQTPDHIMISEGAADLAGALAFETPYEDVWPSDHYGLWADIAFPGSSDRVN